MEDKIHSLHHGSLGFVTDTITVGGGGYPKSSQESFDMASSCSLPGSVEHCSLNNMMRNNYSSISEMCGYNNNDSASYGFSSIHNIGTRTPTTSQRRIENSVNPMFASTNSVCYPEIKKEDIKMSFVGVYVCDDGLVAFGDSKSSKQTLLGSFMSNEDNNVKKVFKGHDFLAVTYGLNEILEAPHVIARLEKVIEPMIKQAYDYKDFLFLLHNHLQEVNESDKYTFIFGVKDKKGYQVVRYAVSNMSIEYMGGPNWRLTCDGVPFYTNRKENIECAITSNKVDVVKQALPIAIKKLITEADTFDIYNPVGGEIQIETLQ